MIRLEKFRVWLLFAVFTICGTASFASCSSNADNATEQSDITTIADKVWAFSQAHPDGFTIDIRTMTEPTEGIAVSYAATQNSHSRDQLDKVVSHALQHEGYVCGWLNSDDGLYYFDSTKLFPEDNLKGSIQFGKDNGQYSVFILSTYTDIPTDGKVAEILDRGTILFGTTGDYRPLSFCEPDGTYWGFGIEIANEIAKRLGVNIEFKKTSWPTLTDDVLKEPQLFDLAIGGITITDTRRETMLMSEGYLANGKTILCRASEADRYQSLADIDKPEVTVMVNPGGLNEKFANENLTHANIVVHQKNEEIPTLIAEGAADVMITEITEAPYYVQTDTRLAAPLLNAPFTHGEIGVLMQKGQEDLLQMVNNVIRQMKSDGSLRKLHEKYGLVYASHEQATFIPQAPDYNDATMWIRADGDTDGTGADIFYVVSTWEEDWTTEDGRICHYADVWNPEHRGRMADLEINKVAAYMSPGNRFSAPFYRHTTMEAWLTQNEDTIMNRTRLAMGDVCAAFDYFQAHRDTSRPLIIAGFSQGGLAVVELLKHIDDETYNQLAAAYVLGYKVTKANMAQCSHIRPAEGETDTGVTICYNTVKDVNIETGALEEIK